MGKPEYMPLVLLDNLNCEMNFNPSLKSLNFADVIPFPFFIILPPNSELEHL